MSSVTKVSSAVPDQVILEGRIKQTSVGQGIDYRMLSSCFTLTAVLKDGTLLGAHFGHFGQDRAIEQSDGVIPGEKIGDRGVDAAALFRAFCGKLGEHVGKGVTELNLYGHLDLWTIKMLGLSDASDVPLSRPKAVEKIIGMIPVSCERVRASDVSVHSYVMLKFAADGMVDIQTSSP